MSNEVQCPKNSIQGSMTNDLYFFKTCTCILLLTSAHTLCLLTACFGTTEWLFFEYHTFVHILSLWNLCSTYLPIEI